MIADKNEFLRRILAALNPTMANTFSQGDTDTIILRKILATLKKHGDNQNDFSQGDNEDTILRKILARLGTVTIS
jgi:hypothetical protein